MIMSNESDIRDEAKKIMDSFSSKLDKIKVNITNPFIEREDFQRNEMEGNEPNLDFKNRLFENAPQKSDDFIIAEKKKW